MVMMVAMVMVAMVMVVVVMVHHGTEVATSAIATPANHLGRQNNVIILSVQRIASWLTSCKCKM